jgi:tetratricopeptide (TPR) repeat protein
MGTLLHFFLNILLILAWLYFSIFCHEHGHFFCGKLVGMNPYLIRVGSGSHISVDWLFKSKLSLGVLPTGGITYSSYPKLDWTDLKPLKIKTIIYILGGCSANCLLALILIYSYAHSHLLILLAFLSMEALFIVCTIFPADISLYGRKFPNDGKCAIKILRQDYRKVYEDAFSIFTGALSRYVCDSVMVRPIFNHHLSRLQTLIEAQELINLSEFSKAVELLNRLLKMPGISNLETVYLLDLLICIVAIHGQVQYLSQADIWSQKAMELASQSNTIQANTIRGSRGGILVELGRFVQAKQLLLPLIEPGNDPLDIIISLCYLAKADYALGDNEQAQRWLGRARKIEKESIQVPSLLVRIEQEMQERQISVASLVVSAKQRAKLAHHDRFTKT